MLGKKINFAIIGCGKIAKKHLECIKTIENASLVGVFDLSKEARINFARDNHVPEFSNLFELNSIADPDVFVVLTPSGSHAQLVKDLSIFGKNIIVEKPIALNINDAEEMIDVCSKNKSTLSIVKQNRFNKPIKLAKNLVCENALGNLFLGTVRVRWSRDQAYYDQASWRGTWKEDGGVVCNQAIHHIDMLQWFFGDVHSVFSSNINAALDIEAEDTSVSVVKFKNGALGVIEASTAIRPKDLEGSISILGTKGSIEIGGFAMNEIVKFEIKNSDSFNFDKSSFINPNQFAFAHLEYYKDYVKTLQQNQAPTIDGHEALKSLKIVHAIYKSNNENREIVLDNEDLQTQLGAI